MKGTSTKLPFLMIFFILASGLSFRRMIGLGAQAQTFYKCKTDADCETHCDPSGCLKNWLEWPSKCNNGQCVCPFGDNQHYVAGRTLVNSTCTLDGDCSNLCPPVCSIKFCSEGKCDCGCHG